MSDTYVHGYHPGEKKRLQDQAGTLVDLLHSDTAYPPASTVLEAGCGVGAQTACSALEVTRRLGRTATVGGLAHHHRPWRRAGRASTATGR